MARSRLGVRAASALLVVGVILEARMAFAVDQQAVEQMMREFEAMKRRLEKVEKLTQQQQQVIERQNETIRQLGGTPKPAPSAGGKAPLPAVTAEAAAAHDEQIKREVTENIMRRIQPSLLAANKTFPAQFNPAIGFIIDSAASYSEKDRANFEFRSGELGLSASVDPFVRGYAILNGTSDEFEVEEAAIVTTSLPYNLGLKGGRFFSDFGRLSKFHDHDLPFVNRPIVLDTYVGGESQADGVEGSWLVPISHYLTVTAGAYNKVGGENERVANEVPRNYSEFTYLGRLFSFLPIDDANSVDLGVTSAYTPLVKQDDRNRRVLSGVDLTYRYTPLSQASYRGLIWGTEVLVNQEDRPVGGFPEEPDPTQPLLFKNRNAVGLYSYLEARLTRRYAPGFLFEYVQDIDDLVSDTTAYSPYLTVWASEFQRIRLQYTRLEAPGQHDNQFFLQWTVVLGSHVHGFKDR
jgi:hypothetical protein